LLLISNVLCFKTASVSKLRHNHKNRAISIDSPKDLHERHQVQAIIDDKPKKVMMKAKANGTANAPGAHSNTIVYCFGFPVRQANNFAWYGTSGHWVCDPTKIVTKNKSAATRQWLQGNYPGGKFVIENPYCTRNYIGFARQYGAEQLDVCKNVKGSQFYPRQKANNSLYARKITSWLKPATPTGNAPGANSNTIVYCFGFPVRQANNYAWYGTAGHWVCDPVKVVTKNKSAATRQWLQGKYPGGEYVIENPYCTRKSIGFARQYGAGFVGGCNEVAGAQFYPRQKGNNGLYARNITSWLKPSSVNAPGPNSNTTVYCLGFPVRQANKYAWYGTSAHWVCDPTKVITNNASEATRQWLQGKYPGGQYVIENPYCTRNNKGYANQYGNVNGCQKVHGEQFYPRQKVNNGLYNRSITNWLK